MARRTLSVHELQDAFPELRERVLALAGVPGRIGRPPGGQFDEFDRDVIGILNLYLSAELRHRLPRDRRGRRLSVKMTLRLIVAECLVAMTDDDERHRRIGPTTEHAVKRIYAKLPPADDPVFTEIARHKRPWTSK
jgi:hypothetical protein